MLPTIFFNAGISAESGIKTFRDADGLWEGHDIYEVASPKGFNANPELVLDFYNQRRKQLLNVGPNKAHLNLVKLEDHFHVDIVTQNVDDLHERAGSSNVLHLHGELLKARSTKYEHLVYNWTSDITLGNLCEQNSQLRPHIVWFGAAVPMLEKAIELTLKADIIIIIGTSMQVYPAASLVDYASENTPIFFIDPKPALNQNSLNNLTVIKHIASLGTDKLLEYLI